MNPPDSSSSKHILSLSLSLWRVVVPPCKVTETSTRLAIASPRSDGGTVVTMRSMRSMVLPRACQTTGDWRSRLGFWVMYGSCLWLLISGITAQEQTALLEFKAAGDPFNHLSPGWDAAVGAPCAGDSWASLFSGWYGIMCDAVGGSVTCVSLSWGHDRGLSGDVGMLAVLAELRVLDLSYHSSIRGNIASLAVLAELRHLNLLGTSVSGDLGSLASLSELGASWTGPDTLIYTHGPYLARSLVHGSSSALDALRALPAVGSAWGQEITHYSPCTAYYPVCEAHGLASAVGAAAIAGQDECECCAGSSLQRDATTRMCVDLQCVGTHNCSGSGGKCYRGLCECHAGFQGQQCESHTGSVDAIALLAFALGGGRDMQNRTDTWTRNSEPCAPDSWDDRGAGWAAVICDRPGGRVTFLGLSRTSRALGSLGGLVEDLSPLTELRYLSLSGNFDVHGNVAALRVLLELRFLGLDGTSVHGEVGSLATCTHLGENWVDPWGVVHSGRLLLAQTGVPAVYGSVIPLRALPGITAEWGSGDWDFSSCREYSCTSGGRALTPLREPLPADLAGRDECACCTMPTVTVRDATDGSCPNSKPAPARSSRPSSYVAPVLVSVLMRWALLAE